LLSVELVVPLVIVVVVVVAVVALAVLGVRMVAAAVVVSSSASCILSLMVLSKLCKTVVALMGREEGLLIPRFSLAIALI
jgi:hypothetical protein